MVISGRGQADVARHVGSVPVWHVSGNHGIEPWARDEVYLPQVRDWVRRLQTRLAPWAGVIIEGKTYSVTIRYRRARQKEPARKAIKRAVRQLRGARVIAGKEAINLMLSARRTKAPHSSPPGASLRVTRPFTWATMGPTRTCSRTRVRTRCSESVSAGPPTRGLRTG